MYSDEWYFWASPGEALSVEEYKVASMAVALKNTLYNPLIGSLNWICSLNKNKVSKQINWPTGLVF